MTTNGATKTMLAILEKHGPVALLCVVLLFGFKTYQLDPMMKERRAYMQIEKETADVLRKTYKDLAISMEIIAESMSEQKETFVDMDYTMRDIKNTFLTFRSKVLDDHPKQNEKLDKILDRVDECRTRR
jgi:hypothetical protein